MPPPLQPGDHGWRDIARRYEAIAAAFRARDVDAFLASLGPDAVFLDPQGDAIPYAATREFWEWRFARMTEIHRFDLAVVSARQSADLVVVEFAEEGDATVARPDGPPARRTWTLRGIDEWRRSPDGWSVCNGEDLEVLRALDGRPMSDQEDPIGWHRWAALDPR